MSTTTSEVDRLWGNRATVRQQCGIGWRTLQRLVNSGAVRTWKAGPKDQHKRLYRLPDVDEALKAEAEGRRLPRH